VGVAREKRWSIDPHEVDAHFGDHPGSNSGHSPAGFERKMVASIFPSRVEFAMLPWRPLRAEVASAFELVKREHL
jgi:hypothetical protein